MSTQNRQAHALLKPAFWALFVWSVSLTLGATPAPLHKSKDDTMNSPALQGTLPGVLLDKPYFTVDLNMKNSAYVVEVNGALVYRDLVGRPMNAELPINHWLRSGENEISIMLLTDDAKTPVDPKTECSITLQVRKSGGPANANQAISRLSYSGKQASTTGGTGIELSTAAGTYDSNKHFYAGRTGDVVIGAATIGPIADGGKIIRQKITLPTPFPEWAFFKSDTLPADVDAMSDAEFERYYTSVLVHYQRIEQALRRGDVDSILPMFAERSREIDTAFYYDPGTNAKELAYELKKIVKRPNTEMLPIEKGHSSVYTHTNRKLLKLTRGGGKDVIVFNLKDIKASESYEIVFRKQGDQWIITR